MSLYGTGAQGWCGSCGANRGHIEGRCRNCGGPWSPKGGIGDNRTARRPNYLPRTFSFTSGEPTAGHIYRAETNGIVAKVVIDLAWRCAEAWS